MTMPALSPIRQAYAFDAIADDLQAFNAWLVSQDEGPAKDTGCFASPTCLACRLLRCVHDTMLITEEVA